MSFIGDFLDEPSSLSAASNPTFPPDEKNDSSSRHGGAKSDLGTPRADSGFGSPQFLRHSGCRMRNGGKVEPRSGTPPFLILSDFEKCRICIDALLSSHVSFSCICLPLNRQIHWSCAKQQKEPREWTLISGDDR
jgi:hypothetical protein